MERRGNCDFQRRCLAVGYAVPVDSLYHKSISTRGEVCICELVVGSIQPVGIEPVEFVHVACFFRTKVIHGRKRHTEYVLVVA